MKKIINGKVYNTETAEEIAKYTNGYFVNDFHFCQETLYRTKKGAWFICGEGGALSSYSVACGNGSSYGESTFVISERDALRWLEKNDENEAIEKYFSEMIEDA